MYPNIARYLVSIFFTSLVQEGKRVSVPAMLLTNVSQAFGVRGIAHAFDGGRCLLSFIHTYRRFCMIDVLMNSDKLSCPAKSVLGG